MAKILIIEDDPTLRNAYGTLLSKEGHKVAVATDGLEGLRMAEESEPELILLDMFMPNLKGLEFLRIYDVKERHPNVKIIVFSNMDSDADVQAAMELGATRYVTKATNSPRQMLEIIKDVCRG